MTKPTEGPYTLGVPAGYTGSRSVANGARILAPDGSLIATISRQPDRPFWEKEANARLLAKSWEMRETLKRAEQSLSPNVGGGSMDREEVLSEIRALLAEIDGEDR